MVNGSCRRLPANGAGRGLCLERLSHSSLQGIWLDDFPNHLDIFDQLVFSGLRRRGWRIVDETNSAQSRSHDGGAPVGRRSVSGQLFRASAVVALSDVWSHWRDRAWHGLRRSHRGAGEMVSGSPRADYRHCRSRIRRGLAFFRARRWLADAACGADAHICLPRRGLRDHRHLRLVHS